MHCPGEENKSHNPGTGLVYLDELLQGLRPGDNVVWQVENLADYAYFSSLFARQAIKETRQCVYLRFADHPLLLSQDPEIETICLDPAPGFDYFTTQLHNIIESHSSQTSYVFDNLSSLVSRWATDELLGNFFQVTCPYIFQLGALAYFALTYGRHSHQTIARIKSTTQIMLNIYRTRSAMYVHPQKVWDRYSTEMFLPHLVGKGGWLPVSQSGEAAAIASLSFRQPLLKDTSSATPWESMYARLRQYHQSFKDGAGYPAEIASLKNAFSRLIIGEHPAFNRLAEQYLTLDDLVGIRERLVGTGRIGGKAAGMLLARRILLAHKGGIDYQTVLEAHDSFYIGSDVFFTFLVNNGLFELRLQLTRSCSLSRQVYEEVQQRFLEGQFPTEIMEQLRNMLDYFGQAPIIVRSSSLMEDSLGNAFAGKYLSEFCTNQGTPEERMDSLLRAVKLVYASTLNPDAIAYRQRQGLSESDEQMAILVQRVSGMPYKHYFFPSLAGVAFSHNMYSWSSRIDPQKGMLRLVFGLGTRAVNRIAGDYSRVIALSHPELRPETGIKIARYSQRNLDVLDLQTNQFTTIGTDELLSPEFDYPQLHLLASGFEDGLISDLNTWLASSTGKQIVFIFNNLIRHTDFTGIMLDMLTTLEAAYGHAVDTEFTAHITPEDKIRINLLQCRSLRLPGEYAIDELPDNLPEERILFRSNQSMSGGIVSDIRYILYIDPEAYLEADPDVKRQLGRLIGRLNHLLQTIKTGVIFMGPGRWGSTNPDLGINVSYSDISHVSVLAEIANEEAGHVPELSYGTHFFQDLVEAQIIYVAIYPQQAETKFNRQFFAYSPNAISKLIPESEPFAHFLHLIDVPAASGGLHAQLAADSNSRRVICYLA